MSVAHVAIYEELADAVRQLSVRGLAQASKWAAEQMTGLETDVQVAGAARAFASSATAAAASSESDLHNPQYLLGKSYFDFKVN
eukprot:366286-Chlamydomonas_euryale.AAC.7